MKTLALLLVFSLTVPAFAAEPIAIFNGQDLAGWEAPHGTWSVVSGVALDTANPRAFLSTSGIGVLLNSADGKTVNLRTTGEWGDCELHVEFCVPKGSNSGIYLMGLYEIQVLDSFGKAAINQHDCGAIYERWIDAEKKGYEGHAPRVNASKAAGEWQSFDITFRAPRFDAAGRKTQNAKFVKVVHNGQVVHENVEITGPTRGAKLPEAKSTGPIVIQGDHGPVAYRNFKLTPQ